MSKAQAAVALLLHHKVNCNKSRHTWGIDPKCSERSDSIDTTFSQRRSRREDVSTEPKLSTARLRVSRGA